jgi:hypothetical protein
MELFLVFRRSRTLRKAHPSQLAKRGDAAGIASAFIITRWTEWKLSKIAHSSRAASKKSNSYIRWPRAFPPIKRRSAKRWLAAST